MIAVAKQTQLSIIEKIFWFVRPYFGQFNDDEILSIINQHWHYGTIDAVYKNNEVIAVCRWNISPNGKICNVLDLVIRPKEDGVKIMKHLIARNWHRFPALKFLRFERDRKYPDRPAKFYSIHALLHLKEKS